jgi:glycosyltransferase involved in cell wall biosynthesis
MNEKPKKLKILHLLSQRPDSTGSGIYIQAMLREAEARNHLNYLLAGIQADRLPVLDCISKSRCSFVQFGGGDISFQIVGMSDVMPYRSNRFCDLSDDNLSEYESSFGGKIKGIVHKFGPDIIHSHHLWILSSLARRLCPEVPVVATCHGSDLRQFQNCTNLQEKVLEGCSRLDAVMALSEAQKKEIERLYHLPADRLYVVGAGYNDRLFTQNLKPESSPVQLIYAGKLSNAKGVPWLLRALAKIDSPLWHLHLVGGGSGAEKERCLRLAQNLGRRVQVHGAVNQQELAAIMKRAHVFILPSFYEGLPLVVLEALASGCRLIANDLPGIREIFGNVQSRYISLVKTPRLHSLDTPLPEDEKIFEENLTIAIKDQISAALKQPQIDLSRMQNKMESFSWTGVFNRIQKVYDQTIESFESTSYPR